MSETITQAFVQKFDDTLRMQAQQMVSRLESAVTSRGTIVGESFTANRLAPISDTPENTQRHGDTQWDEITHSTRICNMGDFYQALPVDRADRAKLLVNPNGQYQASLLAAWNRRKDNRIYRAFIDSALQKTGGSAAMPSGQKILHGSQGLTKGKIIQAKSIFRAREVDEENGEELFFLYNDKALEDILGDTQLTSADFMAVKMLQEGKVGSKWMGFTWIPYQGVDFAASTYTLAAWAKSAVHFGTGFVEGNAQTRGDKKDTWQVSMAASVGAVRVEEEKVVLVEFQ